MKKLIKRCVTKELADKMKNKAISMGFKAVTYKRCGKYACMISSEDDIPEQVANAFLGGCENMANRDKFFQR
jgi:hypothetical protein